MGIFPANSKILVDGILNRLRGINSVDEIIQLQILQETHTNNGKSFVIIAKLSGLYNFRNIIGLVDISTKMCV